MRRVENKWTVLEVPENANHNVVESELVELINEIRTSDSEKIKELFDDKLNQLTHEYLENMYKVKSIQGLVEENSNDEHAYLNAVEVGLIQYNHRLTVIRDVIDLIYNNLNQGVE